MPPWIERDQPAPFDTTPIAGMHALDGDLMAQQYRQDWTEGKKYPLIRFPSGAARELTSGGSDQSEPHVHIFGQLELPYYRDRDEAYAEIVPFAREYGLILKREVETVLRVADPQTGRGYVLAFDNDARRISDMTHFPEYAMELLPGEIRAALPPLYSGEPQGMEAVVPVKYFTPDAQWTWYASEYDGQDLFFGLVSGLEIELGLFSRTELEGIRGPLGLPIERDLYFEPQTLQELQAYERTLRGR